MVSTQDFESCSISSSLIGATNKCPVGVMEAQDSSKVLVKVRVLNGVL